LRRIVLLCLIIAHPPAIVNPRFHGLFVDSAEGSLEPYLLAALGLGVIDTDDRNLDLVGLPLRQEKAVLYSLTGAHFDSPLRLT
jgi:hypothetical protein